MYLKRFLVDMSRALVCIFIAYLLVTPLALSGWRDFAAKFLLYIVLMTITNSWGGGWFDSGEDNYD